MPKLLQPRATTALLCILIGIGSLHVQGGLRTQSESDENVISIFAAPKIKPRDYRRLLPDGMNLLSSEEIEDIHHDNETLTSIIHIGPMKTGSSSLQKSFYHTLATESEADGYEDAHMVVSEKFKHLGEVGIWNVVGCFRDPDAHTDEFIICKPELLPEVHQIAARRHHIILSAEYLTSPDTDIEAIKDFLKPWKEHLVVAYYRRYYEWLHSFHNQGNKKLPTPIRQTLPKFLEKERSLRYWWTNMYIIESLRRWSEHYTNFKIVNVHELPGGDVREPFFCEVLPHTKVPCETFRMKKSKAKNKALRDDTNTNPSAAFVYEDLAYFAGNMNLYNTSQYSIKQAAQQAKYFQEMTLKKTQYDFGDAVECPDEQTANYLLEASLESEKQLFPNYYAERGEAEIRADFAKYVHTKLCHVDSLKVLQDQEEWKGFFRSL